MEAFSSLSKVADIACGKSPETFLAEEQPTHDWAAATNYDDFRML